MTCGGCENAIKRVLGKVEGVTSVETSVEKKSVVVNGTAAPEIMLAALQKWATAAGKTVSLA